MNDDLISREDLRKKLSSKDYITYTHEYGDAIPVEWVMNAIDNAPTVDTTEQEEFAYNEGYAHELETKRPNEQIAWEQGYEAGLAQGKHDKPQITVFTENADEKAIEDMKAELQSVLEARPKGEWIEEKSETGALGIKYTWLKCNQCGYEHSLVIPKNFCPNCGADMK